MENMGVVSLIPVVLAIVLALTTKNTIVSLTIACLVGCFIAGEGIWGLPNLFYEALGNTDFIWVSMCILLFGVLVTYFQRCGAIDGFTRIVEGKNVKRKGVQIISWALGLLCFADSMSPLFVGSVMKKLSDRAKISSEKLAYIADTTASPVSVIYPFSSWPGYLAGLALGIGCIADKNMAYKFVLRAIPFNIYAIACVLLVLLLGLGVVKDFGPMKAAEKRAQEEGKIVADGAVPLSTTDETKKASIKENVFLNFILPMIVLLAICIATFLFTEEVMIVEAVLAVIILMSLSLLIQGMKLPEINEMFLDGIKGAMPAVLVIAVAYPMNTLSGKMGTASYIIELTQGFLTSGMVPLIIFIIAAVLSFATGTSWGTYAICVPIALPIAFNLSGGEVTPLVLATFAAVAGGGVFGDHCSPLSDTTILASMGAGADHIDHVKTQLPYALTCAGVAAVAYLIIGLAC